MEFRLSSGFFCNQRQEFLYASHGRIVLILYPGHYSRHLLWFFRIGGKVVDQFREISVQGFFMGIIAAVNHGDMIGTSLTVDRRVQFFVQTIPVCPYIPEIEQPVP